MHFMVGAVFEDGFGEVEVIEFCQIDTPLFTLGRTYDENVLACER